MFALLLLATLTTGPSAARRTPLVQAVDRAREAVVNINAEEVVRAPAANDPWQLFFGLGRVPNTETLGLEQAGVVTQRGIIATNARMQTNVPHIYAAVDCAGPHEIVDRLHVRCR